MSSASSWSSDNISWLNALVGLRLLATCFLAFFICIWDISLRLENIFTPNLLFDVPIWPNSCTVLLISISIGSVIFLSKVMTSPTCRYFKSFISNWQLPIVAVMGTLILAKLFGDSWTFFFDWSALFGCSRIFFNVGCGYPINMSWYPNFPIRHFAIKNTYVFEDVVWKSFSGPA